MKREPITLLLCPRADQPSDYATPLWGPPIVVLLVYPGCAWKSLRQRRPRSSFPHPLLGLRHPGDDAFTPQFAWTDHLWRGLVGYSPLGMSPCLS
jgi:hypothetical protein